MGFFDEQIKTKVALDEDELDETFRRIAGSVTGRNFASGFQDINSVSENVLEDILKYYHVKMKDIPSDITDINDRLDFALRPVGIMRRVVHLDKGWYKRASGAMLGRENESGIIIALIPSTFGGYYYMDPATGKKVRLNRFNESKLAIEAIAFYQPFPSKELDRKDLLAFINNILTASDIAFMIGCTVVVTLIGMLVPILNNLLMSTVIDSQSLSLLVSTAIFLICVTISKTLFETIGSIMTSRIKSRINVPVEAATMMRVLSLPTGFFDKYSAGELSYVLDYVKIICETLTDFVFKTMLTAVFSIAYVLQTLAFAPCLVIPAFGIIIINIIFSVVSALVNITVTKEKLDYSIKESGLSYAIISGIQKIKMSGAESRAFSKWGKTYAKVAKVTYNPPFIIQANSVITLAISLFGTIWLYNAAVFNNVSVADYYAFYSLYAMVSAAFLEVSTAVLDVAMLKPVFDMVDPILKTVPETGDNKPMVTRLSGSIELEHVSFRYTENQPMIVDDLSLKIKRGQYVAIVGKTGCGKSTLLRLLLGFEKPQKGAIYYDGKNINSVDIRSLRQQIGTVIQNGRVFDEDIFSNIAISAPNLTMDEAWEAAELSGFADDIRQMPMGMFTLLSEDGGSISGGQKQRLLIARALAPKPKILMFDEATSALDNLTQMKVKESLDNLKCTRIVIAHRLSTIKECDRIIVLDHGKIVEDGKYDELMEKQGFFAELVARQKI